MKIKRNGVEIELTGAELLAAYDEAREEHYMDWMRTLLEEYGYPEQDDDKVREMAQNYMDILDGDLKWNRFAERLGELEHDVFEYMMIRDYQDIEKEEN